MFNEDPYNFISLEDFENRYPNAIRFLELHQNDSRRPLPWIFYILDNEIIQIAISSMEDMNPYVTVCSLQEMEERIDMANSTVITSIWKFMDLD